MVKRKLASVATAAAMSVGLGGCADMSFEMPSLVSSFSLPSISGAEAESAAEASAEKASIRAVLDSAYRTMDKQRVTKVKHVDYDVHLRYFTGEERKVMVRRTDLQPMFEAEFEARSAQMAAAGAYGSDICGGDPFQVQTVEYRVPGVYDVAGRCGAPGSLPTLAFLPDNGLGLAPYPTRRPAR